jgi:hypothetical protein
MLRRLILALVAALVFAAPAVAGDIGVTLGFKAGTLGVKAQKSEPGRLSVTVVDARGSGKGWTLHLAGQGAPAVTSISVRCAAGSTCTLPRALPAPPNVLSAAPGSGMGAIEIVFTVTGGRGPLAVTVSG